METATIALGHGINVGVFQVVTFAAAVILVAALDLLLYRTGIGAKIRAVSPPPISSGCPRCEFMRSRWASPL